MALQAFFMKPNLSLTTELESGNLSEPSKITVVEGNKGKICQICFFKVGIRNDGRTLARRCKVYLRLVDQKTREAGQFAWTLRWLDRLKKDTFKRADLHESVVECFRERADIERGPGRMLCVLFTLDCDKKAYLLSTRPDAKPITFDFEQEVEVLAGAVGPRFSEQELGRFRISIHSWNQINMVPVMFETHLADRLHGLADTIDSLADRVAQRK
jgi:hypothetical protein